MALLKLNGNDRVLVDRRRHSRKWLDLTWRQKLFRPLPSGAEFSLVQRGPLRHHPERTRRHPAAHDRQRGDVDQHLVLANFA
jgi:hypothetical protein